MKCLRETVEHNSLFWGVGGVLKGVVAVLATMAIASAFAAASSATTTAAIQAALDQSYPGQGWTVSANGSIDEYGFYNGTDWIQTHPYSQSVPVVLSCMVQVPVGSPWLTFQVASRNSWAGNKPCDWVCNVKVNGRQIYSKTIATLGINNPVTAKIPLDDWAGEEVTLQLENAPGGYLAWNWELAYWRGISIRDGGTEDPTPGCRFSHLFPGWRLMQMPGIDSALVGLQPDNVFGIHPFSQAEPCYALFEGKLTGKNPHLVVDVASYAPSSTVVHDFIFSVVVNGVYIFPRQEVRSATPLQFRYPLDRWLDADSVRIEVHNLAGGSQHAWQNEYAFLHRLEIVDAENTLPAAELSYLNASGAQNINTEYFHNPSTVFDMTVKVAASTNVHGGYACLMGAGTYPGNNAIGFWHQSSSTSNATFGYGNGGSLGGEFVRGVWNQLTVSVPERKVSWGEVGSDNRTFMESSFTADITGTSPLMIFDRNDSDAIPGGLREFAVAKLKSVSISEGETQVRDFIPYRRADGICGLKDRITGIFFPSATSVPFGYGLAYTNDNGSVTVYDGAFSDADDFTGWTQVEVLGNVTCEGNAALAFPGDLVVSGRMFSMSNGVASTATVAGTLTLKGGITMVLDAVANANDGFSVGSLDLSLANAENPIVITLSLDDNVDYTRGLVVIDRGLVAADVSKFVVTNEGFAPTVENGALVLRYGDRSSPVISVWTNAKGDGNVGDAGNWASTNGFGEAVLSVPTSITSVRLPENCGKFSMSVGATLAYRDFRMAPSLGGDCDLRGLDCACEGPVNVGTHKLYLSPALISSLGTVNGDEGGEVIMDVPAGLVWTNSTLNIGGAVKLVKSGAGQLDWCGGTITAASPIEIVGGVLRTVTMASVYGNGGLLTVREGAQLDLTSRGTNNTGNHPLYDRRISISGSGPDGNGALVNNADRAEAGFRHLKDVELSGEATIGGNGRIDILKGSLHGSHKLTVVNTPYLVLNDTLNVKEVLVTNGGQLAFNPGSENSIVLDGVTLRNGKVSTWTPTAGGSYTLPATVPIRVGAEGGRVYAFANAQTLLGLVETTENSTLNFEVTGKYALITNGVGCTMNVNADAHPTFTGAFHNDGVFTASAGSTVFDTTAVVTGSGEIRMSGGSVVLGGDVSGFNGKLVLSGTVAVSEAGLGSFAGCTVIDVSGENGPKDVEGLNWTTAPDGSVLNVRLGSRSLKVGDKVLSWTTAPDESVRFRCEGSIRRNLCKSADGLYIGTGLVVIVR